MKIKELTINRDNHISYEVEIWKDFFNRSTNPYTPDKLLIPANTNNPIELYKFIYENMNIFVFKSNMDVSVKLDIGSLDQNDRLLHDANCTIV